MTAALPAVHAGIAAPGLFLATRYFLVAGAADARRPLNAFDGALLAAGLADVNLVRLSSIVPPGCVRIPPVRHQPGCLVPVAYASLTHTAAGERIASAVAVARPTDPLRAAVVMEYSAVGASRAQAETVAAEMAADALAARDLTVDDIDVIGAEHTVAVAGATFAGVVEL